jgi:hypothetical protein
VLCRYWWNSQGENNKCHWISWENITRPKEDGGLGFRDLHIFKLAMLARQSWRVLQNSDSLCCMVLRVMYFPDTTISEATPKMYMSYTWRSVLREPKLLKHGVIW